MTYQQAFQLCKQRRSTVDPIPAFCEQLKRYEQECRELGYLTATDVQNRNLNGREDGSFTGSNECAKEQNKGLCTIHTETEIVGSKRQVEASGDRAAKRRMSPSIGPSKPSIGTGRPIGKCPSIGPARPIGIGPRSIGPSIGPQIASNLLQTKAPIGPQRPPSEAERSKESKKSK